MFFIEINGLIQRWPGADGTVAHCWQAYFYFFTFAISA